METLLWLTLHGLQGLLIHAGPYAGPCTDIQNRCRDQQQIQTRHHMTPELGESIRRDLRGEHSDTLSDRDDMDEFTDDDDTESDDGWLSHDEGKLGLSKSKISVGHFEPPQREP